MLETMLVYSLFCKNNISMDSYTCMHCYYNVCLSAGELDSTNGCLTPWEDWECETPPTVQSRPRYTR